MSNTLLERWHEAVRTVDGDLLASLLHEDVELHSPFVWKPKKGKEISHFILSNIGSLLENFVYHREWVQDNEHALEFSAQVNGLSVKGMDLITWNDNGEIVRFEVMLRPANAVLTIGEIMTQKLKDAGLM